MTKTSRDTDTERGHNREKEQHVVRITKNLGEERRNAVIDFITKKLSEFKGAVDGGPIEDTHGVPLVIFERVADAHRFADALSQATNYPREHIEIKPRGTSRISGRLRGET